MGFGDAIRTCLNKYATIDGRASRSEYWWFALFGLIVGIPMQIGTNSGSSIPTIVGALMSLAILLPSICVSIRRLHDHDKSGWWLLISLVPLVGFILLIYWFVSRGNVGPKHFGDDPLV